MAPDSRLSTTSFEWKWINGWSAAATLESECSKVTRSYAGKAVVRYAWGSRVTLRGLRAICKACRAIDQAYDRRCAGGDTSATGESC
jgi:hypothetical protein